MAFTTPPGLVYLSGCQPAQRRLLREALPQLRERGYDKIVEPCAGVFTNTTTAIDSGFAPHECYGYDVSLLSSAVGFAASGQSLADLKVEVDGQPVDLLENGSGVERELATLAYLTLRLRYEKKADKLYYRELLKSLEFQHAAMVDDLARQYHELLQRITGLHYKPQDLSVTLAEWENDPHAILILNPPSYKSGYEKFFDTGGRLTWAEPAYAVFDPKLDVPAMMDRLGKKAALAICNLWTDVEEEPAGDPIVAVQLSGGRMAYTTTNRIAEVREALAASPLRPVAISPVKATIIPDDHEITESSSVVIEPLSPEHALYYRGLFAHKFQGARSASNFGVFIDGYLAGLGELDLGPMTRGAMMGMETEYTKDAILLMYYSAPPHRLRLTRLMIMLAMTRSLLGRILPARYADLAQSVVTANLTKHPEAKQNRGILKLVNRKKDPQHGFRLIYSGKVNEDSLSTTLSRWLQKERAYGKTA